MYCDGYSDWKNYMMCQSTFPYDSYAFVHQTFITEDPVKGSRSSQVGTASCDLEADIYDEEYNNKKYSVWSKCFPDI